MNNKAIEELEDRLNSFGFEFSDEHMRVIKLVAQDYADKLNSSLIDELLEELPKEQDMKELDKEDPDNYGALYARAGGNYYREKVIEMLNKKS